jgi:hypothetical protein
MTNDTLTDETLTDETMTEDTTSINDEETPLAAADQTDNQLTGITDQKTPLAGQVCCETDVEHEKHYYWWVLALIAAFTGKVSWDQKNDYDEEKQAEKERKARERARNNYTEYNDDDPDYR